MDETVESIDEFRGITVCCWGRVGRLGKGEVGGDLPTVGERGAETFRS
jgi:hypothetical protein